MPSCYQQSIPSRSPSNSHSHVICSRCQILTNETHLNWANLMRLPIKDLSWMLMRSHDKISQPFNQSSSPTPTAIRTAQPAMQLDELKTQSGCIEKEQIVELILELCGSELHQSERAAAQQRVAALANELQELIDEENLQKILAQSACNTSTCSTAATHTASAFQIPIDRLHNNHHHNNNQDDLTCCLSSLSLAPPPAYSDVFQSAASITNQRSASTANTPAHLHTHLHAHTNPSIHAASSLSHLASNQSDPESAHHEEPRQSSDEERRHEHQTPFQSLEESRLRQSSSIRVSLDEIASAHQLQTLSIKQLKDLLAYNCVDYRGCLERHEFVERANRLWTAHREEMKAFNQGETAAAEKLSNKCEGGAAAEQQQRDAIGRGFEGGAHSDATPQTAEAPTDTKERDRECRICMNAPIECVLLECGHMVSCVKCGRQLAECPICRQFVVRVLRTYLS